MLQDLSSFIKTDFVLQELRKSCRVVSSIEEANAYALDISQGQYDNVIFEKSNLKNYCFAKIRELVDVNIVNCNSSLQRFCESISEGAHVTIFDNVNKCHDADILNLVVNKKGILVC